MPDILTAVRRTCLSFYGLYHLVLLHPGSHNLHGRDDNISAYLLAIHPFCWSLRGRSIRIRGWLVGETAPALLKPLMHCRNFFLFEAIMVPFEITACNLIIHYWSEIVPTGAIIAICICLYGLINVMAVQWCVPCHACD